MRLLWWIVAIAVNLYIWSGLFWITLVDPLRKQYKQRRLRRISLSSLKEHGIPQFFLDDPDTAIHIWGQHALDAWRLVTEPRFRNIKGVPPDWAWRRMEVLSRDGQQCVECPAKLELQIHHIIPKGKGGSHNVENLRTLCLRCHRSKHPEMPDSFWKSNAQNSRKGFARRWH